MLDNLKAVHNFKMERGKGGNVMFQGIKKIGPALLFLLFIASPAFAMSEAQTKEFDRIANLSMPQLTEEAAKALEKKYPNEDWAKYNFPEFVYTNDSSEMGYRIAVKEPGLLSKITCYCFCDRMGHQSLLYCFLKGGKTGGEFDRHASG
jgi:cbb3-type cytochrome oxidase subunit 3